MPDPAASTADYQTALVSSNQLVIVSAQVWYGNSYLATLPNVVDGSVTADITATTRRTCTLTLVSQGRLLDAYVPRNAGDLLHPSTGNELRLFRGFTYPDGTSALIPLGVFQMTKPVVKDTGDTITISITGNDRSSRISRTKWTQPYAISQQSDVASAIQAILTNRWTGPAPLVFNFTPTNPAPNGYPLAGQFLSLPAQVLAADLSASNDPWSDCVALATAAGCELYFDTSGNVVLQPIPLEILTTDYFSGAYHEGATCTMNEVDHTLDESSTYNGVIAIGNGTAGAPVTSQSTINGTVYTGVWNTNPYSATYYDPSNSGASSWGPTPLIVTTSTIPGYQAAQFTGQMTAGLNTISSVSPNPSSMVNGSPVTGPGIPAGATVAGTTSSTITLSTQATLTLGAEFSVGTVADSAAQAQAKINAFAQAQLRLVATALDDVSLQAIPNPALWENDVISVLRLRAGVNDNVDVDDTDDGVTPAQSGTSVDPDWMRPAYYTVQAITMPLDATNLMTVTCVPQRAAS